MISLQRNLPLVGEERRLWLRKLNSPESKILRRELPESNTEAAANQVQLDDINYTV